MEDQQLRLVYQPKVSLADGSLSHGAVDNASGCAQVLAVARAFALLPQRPRRTILALFVAGEERGLLGSAYYAQHPSVPAGRIAANINIDGGNIFGRTREAVLVSLGKSSLDQLAESLVPVDVPEDDLFIGLGRVVGAAGEGDVVGAGGGEVAGAGFGDPLHTMRTVREFIRAGVAGALGSLAWLTARAADRWHLLLVGAIVLLAWNPYTLLDAGFQFSFAAVLVLVAAALLVSLMTSLGRRIERSPEQPSVKAVNSVSAVLPTSTRPRSAKWQRRFADFAPPSRTAARKPCSAKRHRTPSK